MKSSVLRTAVFTTSVTVLGSLLLLPLTFAQDSDSAERPAFRGERMQGPDMNGPRPGRAAANLIGRVDSNADGQVSLDEFIAPRLARTDDLFTCLDTNNDGSLSLTEVTTPVDKHARARFDMLDSSGDGVVTEDEVVARRGIGQRESRPLQDCALTPSAD